MAHFAQLDSTSTVISVIVVDNDLLVNSAGNEAELLGIEFCQSMLGADTRWVQTSYNNNFRVRFAVPGSVYFQDQDVFMPPKPFPSWVVRESDYDWHPPVNLPEGGITGTHEGMWDGKTILTTGIVNAMYEWDEDLVCWNATATLPDSWESAGNMVERELTIVEKVNQLKFVYEKFTDITKTSWDKSYAAEWGFSNRKQVAIQYIYTLNSLLSDEG